MGCCATGRHPIGCWRICHGAARMRCSCKVARKKSSNELSHPIGCPRKHGVNGRTTPATHPTHGLLENLSWACVGCVPQHWAKRKLSIQEVSKCTGDGRRCRAQKRTRAQLRCDEESKKIKDLQRKEDSYRNWTGFRTGGVNNNGYTSRSRYGQVIILIFFTIAGLIPGSESPSNRKRETSHWPVPPLLSRPPLLSPPLPPTSPCHSSSSLHLPLRLSHPLSSPPSPPTHDHAAHSQTQGAMRKGSGASFRHPPPLFPPGYPMNRDLITTKLQEWVRDSLVWTFDAQWACQSSRGRSPLTGAGCG